MRLLVVVFVVGVCSQTDFSKLHRSCFYDSHCKNSALVCGRINQTCQCRNNYVLNLTRNECLAGVGQKCKYDVHCIEGAYCQLQTHCQCKDHLFISEDGLACSKSKQFVSCKPKFWIFVGVILFLINVV